MKLRQCRWVPGPDRRPSGSLQPTPDSASRRLGGSGHARGGQRKAGAQDQDVAELRVHQYNVGVQPRAEPPGFVLEAKDSGMDCV
jgi:hypothetical protein